MGVRVGIYQDLRNPKRWSRPWKQVYAQGFERIEMAEALGIDAVWFTEHHFFDDGYMSQQMLYAAAVAQRTKKIRIGSAIVLAPLHPSIDVAEQAALVDLLSDGRYELGLGTGYRVPEFKAYGADLKKRFPLLEACAREIREHYAAGRVQPAPVQERLPMWLGVMGPRGARMAGRLNEGLLWLDPKLVPPYLEGFAQGGHDPKGARMGGLAQMILAKDPERAWARIAPHVEYQLESYVRHGAEGTDKGDVAGAVGVFDSVATPQRIDANTLRSKGPMMLMPAVDVVTPEDAIDRLTQWLAPIPATDVFFWDCLGGMADDLVREHIELLGTKVRPAMARLQTTYAGPKLA